jgi:hypothetical protein
VTIQFRADVFNRLHLNNPNVTVTGAEFGRISSARIPRQTQLSFRVVILEIEAIEATDLETEKRSNGANREHGTTSRISVLSAGVVAPFVRSVVSQASIPVTRRP